MTPDAIRSAAERLIGARKTATAIEALPADCVPRSLEDGHAIQDAMLDLCGWPLAGYKIGCTSGLAQEMLGTDRPFPGRVFRPFLHTSPATLAIGSYIKPGVEGEFAFELSHDVPSRPTPWKRAEIEGCIGALYPAIEVIDTRFTRFTDAGIPNLLADTGANGGLVLGKAILDWPAIDLEAAGVVMKIGGAVTGQGHGRDVLGHPLEALTWLANDLSRRGRGLMAGQIVTTGTCTGMQHVPPGRTAKADFGALGTVSVTVSA